MKSDIDIPIPCKACAGDGILPFRAEPADAGKCGGGHGRGGGDRAEPYFSDGQRGAGALRYPGNRRRRGEIYVLFGDRAGAGGQ